MGWLGSLFGALFGGGRNVVAETAEVLHRGGRTKPTIAAVSGMAGSAAYWIASNASELVVTPSGEVGSIGVWSMHVDESQALDRAGYVVTLVLAGKYKTGGHPYGPMDAEALAHSQADVNSYFADFLADVARGRRVSRRTVERSYGEGRMMRAKPALNRPTMFSCNRPTLRGVTVIRATNARPRSACCCFVPSRARQWS